MRLVAVVRALIAILDTPGGHMVILMTLIALGVALQVRGFENSGKELSSGALGALFAVLRYQTADASDAPRRGVEGGGDGGK
jgi:hypothetical protein